MKKIWNEFLIILRGTLAFSVFLIIMIFFGLIATAPMFIAKHYANNWWNSAMIISLPLTMMLCMRFADYVDKLVR